LSNLALSHLVENHPGEKGLSGIELLEKIRDQVASIGVEIIDEKTISIEKSGNFIVTTTESRYETCAVIIATGLVSRKANIKGEERYLGKGVSYCVLCDGPLFRGKDVIVVGGGDSACSGAASLKSMGAKEVYLIHRRNEFRAEKSNIDKMQKAGVHIILDSVIEEISGDNFVKSVKIRNVKNGEGKHLAVEGIFIEIGYVPTAELAKNIGIELDKDGFIIVNDKKETNVKGAFAVGDVTSGSHKILVMAYSDGATAALNATKYACDKGGKEFRQKLY
jgi:thioredoxin reductase (NADPH)